MRSKSGVTANAAKNSALIKNSKAFPFLPAFRFTKFKRILQILAAKTTVVTRRSQYGALTACCYCLQCFSFFFFFSTPDDRSVSTFRYLLSQVNGFQNISIIETHIYVISGHGAVFTMMNRRMRRLCLKKPIINKSTV